MQYQFNFIERAITTQFKFHKENYRNSFTFLSCPIYANFYADQLTRQIYVRIHFLLSLPISKISMLYIPIFHGYVTISHAYYLSLLRFK